MPAEEKTNRYSFFKDDPELVGKPAYEQFMIMAKRHYDRARQYEHSALLEAQKCGHYLNEAKKELKIRKEARWTPHLRKLFTKKGIRTAQIYMQLALEEKTLEPVVREHPDLPIIGAVRFLRTGKVHLKKDERTWDPVEFHLGREWAKVKRMWADWPEEAKAWLHNRPDLLEDLLLGLVRENADPEDWPKYVPARLRGRIQPLAEKEIRERKFRAERKEFMERFEPLLPELAVRKEFTSRHGIMGKKRLSNPRPFQYRS